MAKLIKALMMMEIEMVPKGSCRFFVIIRSDEKLMNVFTLKDSMFVGCKGINDDVIAV